MDQSRETNPETDRSIRTIGLIGCGAIGGRVARFIQSELKQQASLTALFDVVEKSARDLLQSLQEPGCRLCTSSQELISCVDLVIEAASPAVSADIAEACQRAGKDVIIMSVGGLLDKESLWEQAGSGKGRIYVPSGAIAGIDCVHAAAVGTIETVQITTRKPPKGLAGAPYLVENNISLNDPQEERVVFQGSAREAVKGFPKNINVSALLSLAGLGPDKTTVRIVTSPEYTQNSHEIKVVGDFGEVTTRTENVPDPSNPRTSYLAALSVCALLKKILGPIWLGT